MTDTRQNRIFPASYVGVILVDHGSRFEQSNRLLEEVVEAYRQHAEWQIVEPAHMELASPTIAEAFARCVEGGAELVVVFPYFLGPGRHWSEDIPRLAAAAAEPFPEVRHLVTEPLGLDPLLLRVIDRRIGDRLRAEEQENLGKL